ncbi:MAG: exopolysaccharide production protein [Pseudomonadota bacterium]
MTVSVSERYTERLNASKIIKRVIDIIGSLALLVLFSPLFLVVALMVSLDGGPVFYRHKRIGRDGKPFGCLKFRTMILGAEACLNEYLSYHPEQRREWEQDQKLAFDPRVTAIGNVLRRLSFDELPQLVNVLVGEMSLVGPRPVTEGELKHYGAAASAYLAVRPGLTGPWQVSGRNDVSYATRVAMDEAYVRNFSLWNDIVILLRTPGVVLSKKGAR